MDEAPIRRTAAGDIVDGPGWFVVNVGDARWERHAELGTWYVGEAGDAPFPHYGIGIHVLQPGQANGRYHAESAQEDFLVLAGECLLVIEEQERRLRAWDFVHCPAGTNHVFVGAGDGPCGVLMIGARPPGRTIDYPASERAQALGAGVETPTASPGVAYAPLPSWQLERPGAWAQLPWA
jgi:uncharacterized cupin superfamily protein